MFTSQSPNVRGIMAMVSASILFVFSDLLAKYAATFWPIAQIMSVRGVFAIALGLAMVAATGNMGRLAQLGERTVIGRSAVEGFIALTYLSALPMMPIADLISLLMLSPLVITVLAIVLFGEVVGWRRWTAIAAGFVGILLVIQPGRSTEAMPLYFVGAGLGVCSVFGVAVRDILTRRVGHSVPSVVVTLAASIGSFLTGLLLTFWEPWAPFSWVALLCCIAAAVIVTVGNVMIVLACREAELSVVAPYRFTSVLWAITLGALLFGEYPGWLSLAGMATVAATGVYTLHRERVRANRPGP